MKTKFIGLEGFNEIESLSTEKKRSVKKTAQLTTAQKTVRFAKRAGSLVAKEVVNNTVKLASFISEKTASTLANRKSAAKTVNAKKPASLIDKCYLENRKGLSSEYSSSVKDAITSISFTSNKKYAHSAPRTHAIIKKKAILAVVAALTVIMLSCVTVASALDVPEFNAGATVVTTTEGDYSTTPTESNNSYLYTSTSDEAVSQIGKDAYATITKALINDNIHNGCSGLFIDGELIGATDNADALNSALEQVLVDYRANYDEETTTEFANDVSVRQGNFSEEYIMPVSEIISNAEGKFSISLSTDIVYTREVAYETETEYDESRGSSYEEVKTEGKNGEELVIIRTTFTDGVQTDAVETGTKVIHKAVNEVVVKGSKKESSKNTSYGSSTGSFMWPVPYTHSISSYYEWRWGRMHWGIDIAAGGIYGQDIVASDGGTVTFAGDDGGGYGYYVIIDHGNGYSTCYAHCSSLAVSAGQYVSQGETIGYVGSTGYSTGPHLHFEVRKGSDKLNPLDFVS